MRHVNLLHNESGAALVETAISSILVLGFIFALFELFLGVYTYHFVSYAAREGSRYAVVRGSQCDTDSNSTMPGCGANSSDIQTYVQGMNLPGITSSNISVTATWYTASTSNTGDVATPVTTTWSACTSSSGAGYSAGCNAPGNAVNVTVSYPYPLDLVFYRTSLNLTSTSQMVISQ